MAATHYTDSKGEKLAIANMVFAHLFSAHRKAVAKEEREHEFDPDYSNPEREAEIEAMAAEIERRNQAYAE